MTASNNTIVESYESLGMTPDEIATDQLWEVESVKLVLLQHSPLYRERLAVNGSEKYNENSTRETFNKEEELLARDVIVRLAGSSEFDAIAFRAARFIIDERKGRNDIQTMKTLNLNVTLINQRMRQAKQALARAKEQKIIDIEPTKQLEETNNIDS